MAQVKHENGSIETEHIQSIEEAHGNSLRGKESEAHGNRIHFCLLVSRPLRAYKPAKELLEPPRDAIFGHKLLVEDGKILHQDISGNDVIITKSTPDGDPKGRLIDLDLFSKGVG